MFHVDMAVGFVVGYGCLFLYSLELCVGCVALLVGGCCVDLVLVSLVVAFAVWCCGCVLLLLVVFMVVGFLGLF